MANTFELLARIVSETKGPPNWSFRLADEDGAKRLVIRIRGRNNYHPDLEWSVDHWHPVPIAEYNERTWQCWIFAQCQRTMVHELGEQVTFADELGLGGAMPAVRPFAPMHGPGDDPYLWTIIRTTTDALTTQDGSLWEPPV